MKINGDLPSDKHRHHEQVEDSIADTVPNPVFGASGAARMVRYRYFSHDGSAGLCQDRKEAMNTLKSRNDVQHTFLEHTKVAAGVGKINAQN